MNVDVHTQKSSLYSTLVNNRFGRRVALASAREGWKCECNCPNANLFMSSTVVSVQKGEFAVNLYCVTCIYLKEKCATYGHEPKHPT